MNVAFRPCTPADIATLWQFSCEPELGEIPSPAEIWRLAECFAEAMLLDGELAACGGIALDWPGRGVGWVLARPGLSRRAWAMATRRLRQAIAQAQAPAFGASRRASTAASPPAASWCASWASRSRRTSRCSGPAAPAGLNSRCWPRPQVAETQRPKRQRGTADGRHSGRDGYRHGGVRRGGGRWHGVHGGVVGAAGRPAGKDGEGGGEAEAAGVAAYQEREVREKALRERGAAIAAAAASGVTLEGRRSPLEESSVHSELDALATRYGGQVGGWHSNAV